MYYDFENYINSIKYLDYDDIISTTYEQHRKLDKVTKLEKKDGAGALQDKISGLLYWMETKSRPPGLMDEDFLKLRPICVSLVEKKQLDPEQLELFDVEVVK